MSMTIALAGNPNCGKTTLFNELTGAGEIVRVLGDNSGGMILMVKGVKVALNRGLASRIMVAG